MEKPSLGDDSNQATMWGDKITVLSIDGGGIRGIIPATILSFLESKLQVCTEITSSFNVVNYIEENLSIFLYGRLFNGSNRNWMERMLDLQITLM